MRILFLIRSLEPGGAERQLSTLAAGLARRGHDVAVAVLYGGGAYEVSVAASGAALIDLGKRSRWDVAAFGMRAARAIRRFRPEIVHGYLVAGNLLAVTARVVAPSARVVWGLRATGLEWSRYDRLARLTFQAERAAAPLAHLLIVNSEAGRAYHAAEGFPERKLRVIPNGIDLVAFRPDRSSGKALRARWGFGDEHRVFGVVGRLDPMKDHATFLEAASIVAASDPEARFVAIGSGPVAPSLQKHPAAVRLGGRLIWAGSIGDMAEAYNALDVLVLSSAFGEGFPNAVAEAMACGLKCAVTDVGDAARIVADTGLVAPVREPKALAAAMTRLAAPGLQRPPFDSSRERIEQHYSEDRLCDRTETLLTSLLKGGKA